MDRESLSNIDFALLRLDSPDNRMIVNALMTFQGRLELERLKEVLTLSLLQQPRFRQRIVYSFKVWGKAQWETDPGFNLDRHVKAIHTHLPENPKLLQELVGRVMSAGLDHARPLWQFYLIEHYGSGSALVMRFHHSIADGMSLVKLLLLITESTPDGWQNNLPEDRIPATAPTDNEPIDHAQRPRQTITELAGAGRQLLSDRNQLEDAARLGANLAGALGQLLFGSADFASVFRGPTSIEKQAAWSPALSLEQVKLIGKTYGSTVNDVLLSIVTGALRQYMLEKGTQTDRMAMHSFVPIDLRRETRKIPLQILQGVSTNGKAGNHFGFAVLPLPVEIDDPIQRLEAIRQSMDLLKVSGEALVSSWVFNLMGAFPGEIQDLAERFWLTKGSAVMTNVAGPGQQLYLGGVPIDSIMGWVPQTGSIGLGISIFSYNGKVWLGVATDQGLAPDPQKIVDFFLDEFQSLKQNLTE